MVVGEPKRSIMDGIENTGDVRLHDHRLRLKQRFDIIRKLGQGTYGKVQLGINKKTGQEVAIKTIKKCKIETEADLVRIRREVQIMSSVRHPNIVHIYEVFENSEKMILVMEYCAGGELYDYLSQQKVLQEDEARRLFRQIATAVYYCHKHKICHRDLKLENVLLDEHGSAKIADFGLSNVFEERRLLSTFCGSPLYASPEIVKGTPYIGPEVDCWSLGVLLYTLVYGAMPFDGSNFKRLVKQISTGDYFEPKNPSSASPLIRDMLTVDPVQRADITHICDNPWVNKGSDVSCLELAEALANETPVRLDLLLSLVPPPSIGGDKLVVTDEVNNVGPDGSPARSMSVANIDNSAERRILEMVAEGGTDAIKPSPTRTIVNAEQPKRKLETTVSMDSAPSQRKKERSIRSSSLINQNSLQDDASMTVIPNAENNGDVKNIENRIVENQEIKRNDVEVEPLPAVQHQESVTFDISPKLPNAATNMSQLTLEIPNETVKIEPTVQRKSPEKLPTVATFTNKELNSEDKMKENMLKAKNITSKTTPALKKRIVTSSLNKDDKIKSTVLKEKSPPRKSIEKDIAGRVLVTDKKIEDKKTEEVPAVAEPPKQRTERRRSRILDTTEKLNNLSIQPAPPSTDQQSPPLPKPKKVIIPGVSVGSFKEQFERRASLTSGANVTPSVELKKPITKPSLAVSSSAINSKPLLNKKVNSVDSEHPFVTPSNEQKETGNVRLLNIGVEPSIQPREEPPKKLPLEPKKPAIVEINKVPKMLHKSESLKEPSKSDHEFNMSLESARRNLQQSMALLTQARSESKPSMSSNDDIQVDRQKQLKTAREIISNAIGDDGKKVHRASLGGKPPVPYGSGGRSSSGTISLSSMNSLPGSPPTSPPHARTMVRESPGRTFRTEVQHRIDDVRNNYSPNFRGGSVERIIPIHFAEEGAKIANTHNSSSGQLPYQRNNSMPYRFSSLPRGCTSDSESESVQQPSTPISHSKPEPIKKSPREFIIPIAVEGKGYVTPRQGSLEPTDTPTKLTPSNIGFMSRFPKPRRLSSLVSGGESEDDDDMHMHRLRSTRRVRTDAEKESVSSGEEDEDERFEILTAENLFSTLLDRVRSLTNRLNGEEGTGFPQHHQSIFNNLHSPFFNSPHLPRTHKRHNVIVHQVRTDRSNSETREGPSWRRSTSRDIGSDFDSMFPSHPTFPRGSRKSRQPASNSQKKTNQQTNTDTDSNTTGQSKDSLINDDEHLDLSDLDLSKIKLSEKDMEMLSGLTPALSRRLQKQLLDHLPPAAARSLRRTLSMNNPYGTDSKTDQHKYYRSSSASKTINKENSLIEEDDNTKCNIKKNIETSTSFNNNNNNKEISSTNYADQSSISQSSILGNSDNFNNNICDYSDSLLLRDQSGNSLDLNSSRIDSISESLTPRFVSNVKNTPDRSILSKYLSPDRNNSKDNYYSQSRKNETTTKTDCYGNYDLHNTILDNLESRTPMRQRSLKTPPIDTTPRRRISRFLRPDFFDTPREESIYVRDKKDKESETQRVLREIRDKRNRSGASSPCSPSVAHDILPFFEHENYSNSTLNCLSPLSPVTPNRSRSVTPFYPILDNISEIQHDSKANKEQFTTVYTFKENQNKDKTNDISTSNTNKVDINNKIEDDAKFSMRESKLIRPKSFPLKQNDSLIPKNDISVNQNEKSSVKESKMMRPKSYPATTPSPEKKATSNIPYEPNLTIEKKSIDLVNNNLNVNKPIVRNVSPVNDDNGNMTVSFNINLPSKTPKVEENVDDKKLPPVKKKVVVKKKVISPKSKVTTKEITKNGSVVENNDADVSTKVVIKDTEPKVVKKKSVLQSLGQKFERLRNDSFSKNNSNDKETTPEKSQSTSSADKSHIVNPTKIENSVRTLREQSVPNVMHDEPTTESGLIKRAVTVTDLQTLNNKENQSKKSVNRVFGLFKKVDSKDKAGKPAPIQTQEVSKENNNVESLNNVSKIAVTNNRESISPPSLTIENKPKRPTSLLLNGIGKRVQACYNGATSDSVLSKTDKKTNVDNAIKSDEVKSQKKGLRLDFSRLPKINQGIFNKRNSLDLTKNKECGDSKDVNDNQQSDSVANSDEAKSESASTHKNSIELNNGIYSPAKNNDVFSNGDIPSPLLDTNWSPDYDSTKFMNEPKANQYHSNENSVLSDTETDVASPETENLIDRIRRKSFYSRFNEKKNRRKSSLVGPGAKEYIPSARINPQCDNDNMHYTNKYDLSPTLSPKYNISSFNYEPSRSLLDKSDCLSPTSSRLRGSMASDQFLASGLKSNEKKYSDITIPGGYDSNQYSIPRYSRTLSYLDNYDSKQPAVTDPKSSRARYGRTLSLLSPGIYATYSPRSHTRNSAILLKEATDVENSTENILTKIRNRKKNNYDDGQTLETKYRSNPMHESEHDLPADDTE